VSAVEDRDFDPHPVSTWSDDSCDEEPNLKKPKRSEVEEDEVFEPVDNELVKSATDGRHEKENSGNDNDSQTVTIINI
jgi:hypothetical protein